MMAVLNPNKRRCIPGSRLTRWPRLFLWARRKSAALAALEFALVAPFLGVLFIGVTDAAQLFQTELRLASAVSAGAAYALVNQSSVNSTGAVTLASAIAAIVGNVNGTGWAGGTVVVNNGATASFANGAVMSNGTAANADSYYCPSGSTGSWNWGTAASGNTTLCGTSAVTAGKFVTITAMRAFTPDIIGLGFLAGTLQQSVAVQVQ
jgi:Flp pilus assembly protein TadG